MSEHTNGARKLTTYPVNLQSLLQSTVLIVTLLSGVVYAAQRITALEKTVEFQSEVLNEQRLLMREANSDLKRALGNQEMLMRELRGEGERRR